MPAQPDDHTRATTQPTTRAMMRLLEDHHGGKPRHEIQVSTRAEYTGPGQRYILHAELIADDGYRINLKYDSEPGSPLALVHADSGHRPGIVLITPGGAQTLPYHLVRKSHRGRAYHTWVQRNDDVARSLHRSRRIDRALARALAGESGPDYLWERDEQPSLVIRAGMRVEIPPTGPGRPPRTGIIAIIRPIVFHGRTQLDINLVADDGTHFTHAAAGAPADHRRTR